MKRSRSFLDCSHVARRYAHSEESSCAARLRDLGNLRGGHRSLRENNCQLTDCFALVRNGEVWLHNLHIAPYSHGNIANPDPDRVRKLLLHRNQIRDLVRKTQEKGMALVPLKIYFDKNSRVKIELAVARGKKLYDKRAAMAERDSKREIDRALKARNRSY